MSDRALGLARLMEGGLDELRRRPAALVLFLVADAAAGYLTLWMLATNLMLGLLLSVALASPVSSLFMMALGGNLRAMVADPIELTIRLVFALAVTLLVSIGSALGSVLLILPGLYLGARWMVAGPMVLLEGCGIIEAMSRSWRLTEPAAWPLVGAIVVLAIPNFAFQFFGNLEPIATLGAITPQAVLQLAVGAALASLSIAISVFASAELTDRLDPLIETFA